MIIVLLTIFIGTCIISKAWDSEWGEIQFIKWEDKEPYNIEELLRGE